MTDERRNEIWAMLDVEAQEWIKEQYQEILEDIADYKAQNTDNGSPIMENRAIGQKQILIRLFGSHNLTAQVEEKPKCTNPTENGISGSKIQSESAESVETSANESLNGKRLPYGKRVVTPFGEGIIGMDIEGHKCVKLDAGGCAGIDKAVLIAEADKPIDYAAHRLDLAKEIAVAIINTANKDARYGDTLPYVAVKIANEIVERLKETEE